MPNGSPHTLQPGTVHNRLPKGTCAARCHDNTLLLICTSPGHPIPRYCALNIRFSGTIVPIIFAKKRVDSMLFAAYKRYKS